MSSISTLDEGTVEYLQQINHTINTRKEWTPEHFKAVEESLQLVLCIINKKYHKATGTSLEETTRRLLKDVQGGGIETYIEFYNAFLFIRKMQYKLRWRQRYGTLPE